MVKKLTNALNDQDTDSHSSEISIGKKIIKRKKRAKKADLNERKYKCDYCNKKYLSKPALCTHKKQKHSLTYISKDPVENLEDNEPKKIKFIKAKEKYTDFFNDENKVSKFIDNTEQKEKIKQIFNSNLILDLVSKSSDYKNIEEYPFYKLIIEEWEKDQTKTAEESFIQKIKNNYISKSKNRRLQKRNVPPLDEIFLSYLKQLNKNLKHSYLSNITLFIISFRKFINDLKRSQITPDLVKPGQNEFTHLFNARDLPEIANDYFNDFLPKYSECINNEIRKDFIDIIQHFCFWLYDNNYSDCILSLNE